MSTDLVGYSVSNRIAEIVLDRAPVNALSIPLIDALLAALANGALAISPAARKAWMTAFLRMLTSCLLWLSS